MIRLRFVQGAEFSSRLIELSENDSAPLIPSHVELVVPTGYLGAVNTPCGDVPAGVYIRPVGYDKGTFTAEAFYNVTGVFALAQKYAENKIGHAYDWAAVLDYVLPTNFHETGDYICSALMTATLRAGHTFGLLARPDHLISPSDLLLVVTALGATLAK